MMKLKCENCNKKKLGINEMKLCRSCMIEGLVILYKTEKPS